MNTYEIVFVHSDGTRQTVHVEARGFFDALLEVNKVRLPIEYIYQITKIN